MKRVRFRGEMKLGMLTIIKKHSRHTFQSLTVFAEANESPPRCGNLGGCLIHLFLPLRETSNGGPLPHQRLNRNDIQNRLHVSIGDDESPPRRLNFRRGRLTPLVLNRPLKKHDARYCVFEFSKCDVPSIMGLNHRRCTNSTYATGGLMSTDYGLA
jgi:hypothetical protein